MIDADDRPAAASQLERNGGTDDPGTDHDRVDLRAIGTHHRANVHGRMLRMSDIEAQVRRALDLTGTESEIVPCDPALADTAAFCQAYGYSLDESANTIVVAGKSDPPRLVACIVLASTRLDVNGAVRRRMGVRKASFA